MSLPITSLPEKVKGESHRAWQRKLLFKTLVSQPWTRLGRPPGTTKGPDRFQGQVTQRLQGTFNYLSTAGFRSYKWVDSRWKNPQIILSQTTSLYQTYYVFFLIIYIFSNKYRTTWCRKGEGLGSELLSGGIILRSLKELIKIPQLGRSNSKGKSSKPMLLTMNAWL